jgi:hypothetical protein
MEQTHRLLLDSDPTDSKPSITPVIHGIESSELVAIDTGDDIFPYTTLLVLWCLHALFFVQLKQRRWRNNNKPSPTTLAGGCTDRRGRFSSAARHPNCIVAIFLGDSFGPQHSWKHISMDNIESTIHDAKHYHAPSCLSLASMCRWSVGVTTLLLHSLDLVVPGAGDTVWIIVAIPC